MLASRPHSHLRGWFGIACCAALALGVFGVGADAAFAKSSKPTVKIATVSGVGPILVASNGHSLYTLTNAGQPVACTGQCAAIWPPLTAKGTPKGAKGVTGLGTVSDGNQVTVKGVPVHMFAGDAKAGTASGEGITSFGGTWHVVKTAKSGSGGTTKTPSSSTPATNSSSSNSGYGY